MEKISPQFEKYRRALGLKLVELAGEYGVSHTTVSNWERGVSQPSFEILASLAKKFGVSTDELLGLAPAVAARSYVPRFALLPECGPEVPEGCVLIQQPEAAVGSLLLCCPPMGAEDGGGPWVRLDAEGHEFYPDRPVGMKAEGMVMRVAGRYVCDDVRGRLRKLELLAEETHRHLVSHG